MIRTKLGLLGLCAVVLGVMAMSAASAQALSWLVLNAAGTVATEVKFEEIEEENAKKEKVKLTIVNLLAEVKGEVDTANPTLLTKLVGLKVGVTCTNFETKNIFLEPEGKLAAGGQVVFTGCTVTLNGAASNCTVKSPGAAAGTVLSNKGKGELVLHEIKVGEKEVLTKIEAESAAEGFATLRFEGECALPEVNKVTGTLFVKDCEKFATTHKVKHLITQGPLTSLSVGADTAEHLETSIDGSAWVKLAGAHVNLAWAGMDP